MSAMKICAMILATSIYRSLSLSISPKKSLTMAGPSSSSSSSSSNKKSYDLLVIGGGAAGLTAAKFATTFGKSVAIIEKAKMGGDCTWTGCVPSKSLIASSKVAHTISKASNYGININQPKNAIIDMKAVKDRVKRNIEYIYKEEDSPEAMKKLGIDTIVGMATFKDAKLLQVQDELGNICEVYANDGVLIATGAKPKDPQIGGLDSIDSSTYEEAFEIENVPETMTVVGGGPIGAELAQAYSRLGAKVTVIASKLLPREEPEVGEVLQRVFEKEGIHVTCSRLSIVTKNSQSSSGHVVTCENGEIVSGDLLLVAVGREPVVDGMGLSELGVELSDNGGIKVDNKLQTTVKGIYAAGDCTGDKQFTHYAGYQGAVGARNILLPFTDPGVMTDVPATTFTDPQIASVGLTEKDAKDQFGEGKVAVAFKEIKETDRAICDGVEEGFIKIIYMKRGYKILGACIMSPVAGELIAEISVAMKAGMTFDMLATVVHTYPSHSFAIQSMAAELYYDKLVKLKPILNFLKRIGF